MAGLTDKIAAFLTVGDGIGAGIGAGRGYGWCSGTGDGFSSGFGDGYGWGRGAGSCDGSGEGRGAGRGAGSGEGTGAGSGDGSGEGTGAGRGAGRSAGWSDGWSDGCAIKEFRGSPVILIDNTPTVIRSIRGNVAHGAILQDDLTTEECYVAKQDNTFAHGRTLREAMNALREKLFTDLPQEERIAAFISEHPLGEAYPCRDLYDWHHRLTGSCEMGRNAFAKDHGIDVERDTMTVERFIKLTRSAYGGDVIRALERAYKEG